MENLKDAPSQDAQHIHLPLSPPPGNYLVVLDQFHISKTRSVHLDTDYVTLTAQVNQQPPVNQTVFVGDVNDGDHPVNLQLGPFFVGPNDTLAFNYVVLNKGHSNGDRKAVEDALAAAATKAIVAEFPAAASFAAAIRGLPMVGTESRNRNLAQKSHGWPLSTNGPPKTTLRN